MRDLLTGLTIAALGAAVLVVLPGQADSSMGMIVTSASMPGWLAWALLVFGLLMAAGAARSRPWRTAPADGRAGPLGDQGARTEAMRGWAWVLAAIAIGVAHAVLMPRLGYLIATTLALPALALVYGGRSWLTVLLPALLIPGAVYLFFRYAMLVFLPAGSVF